MSLCFSFANSLVPPAVMKSASIQTTKCPKHQERVSIKAFCSFSIQGMNSKGNLGAREDSSWGQPALVKQPGRVGVFTQMFFVCAYGKEKNLVERAAAASCSGILCQMPWHCGYSLFKVKCIQFRNGESFLLLFPEIYHNISHLKYFFINRLLEEWLPQLQSGMWVRQWPHYFGS